MDDIVWENPPDESEDPLKKVADTLRANPRRWANIKTSPNRANAEAIAYQIESNTQMYFSTGKWETEVRKTGLYTYKLYVRFMRD